MFLVVQFCEELNNIPNGAVNVTVESLENTIAGYSCITGYEIVGDETRVCERNPNTIPGMWSGSEPVCRCMFFCHLINMTLLIHTSRALIYNLSESR